MIENQSCYRHLKIQEGCTFQIQCQNRKGKKVGLFLEAFGRKPWVQREPPWTNKCRMESWKKRSEKRGRKGVGKRREGGKKEGRKKEERSQSNVGFQAAGHYTPGDGHLQDWMWRCCAIFLELVFEIWIEVPGLSKPIKPSQRQIYIRERIEPSGLQGYL